MESVRIGYGDYIILVPLYHLQKLYGTSLVTLVGSAQHRIHT